ncbi:MAG: hypothetical protein M3133_09140 [Actinomycetota bacterium]|nr:hypothetical protein [Actinomycetota bacterium]
MTRLIHIRACSPARGLAAALLAATLLLGACGQQEADQKGATPQETPTESVFANPRAFLGQEVELRGRVGSVVSRHMFNLEDLERTGERVQVFTRGEPRIDEGQVVRVEGSVREFDIAAFEQELQVDLEDELFDAFIGTPVILARSVQILEQSPDEVTEEPGVVGVSPTGRQQKR